MPCHSGVCSLQCQFVRRICVHVCALLCQESLRSLKTQLQRTNPPVAMQMGVLGSKKGEGRLIELLFVAFVNHFEACIDCGIMFDGGR